MDKSQSVLNELEKLYPDAQPALHFKSAYELLVAVILSAQCTDERVNKVTDVLFRDYNTPEDAYAYAGGAGKVHFFVRVLP